MRSRTSRRGLHHRDRSRRFAALGDLHAGIDQAVFSLETLLEWAERDERDGSPDRGDPEAP